MVYDAAYELLAYIKWKESLNKGLFEMVKVYYLRLVDLNNSSIYAKLT